MFTLTHGDYTVGWICALSIELTAAIAMLDEKHSPLPQDPSDHNTYILGRIGKHNVAVACLPAGQIGNNSAAIVADQMKYSFRSIRFGVMVGIGGGVPSAENDIRLGDVVVSKPGLHNGGVVQYDFGKLVEGGVFKHTGSLNSPPPVLLTALSTLQAQHEFSKRNFIHYLSDIPASLKPKFSYVGHTDKLFDADYDHVEGGPSCEYCVAEKLVTRAPRQSSEPHIHYGTIASGNEVMRHGATRDRIGRQFGVLCFEMEAAGLMNNFPCVVIRGICDYADSHKNKQWQPYAAMAAAAYTKELLSIIVPEQIPGPSFPLPTSPPDSGSSSPTIINNMAQPQSPDSGNSPQSSLSTAVAPGSFFVFCSRRLPSHSVALGRLIINMHAPWEDFCPHPLSFTDGDIGITPQRRLRELLNTTKGTPLYDRVIGRLSHLMDGQDAVAAVSSVSEKTYLLLNSGNWFKKACQEPDIRAWLNTMIKIGRAVYMIVAIHTAHESPNQLDSLERRLQQVDLAGVAAPSAATELIVGIQYRKVQFRWFWSRNMDAAFLEVASNRWQVVVITKSMDEDEGMEESEDVEEDIVEANLQEAIAVEDVGHQGDAFTVSGQVVVM